MKNKTDDQKIKLPYYDITPPISEQMAVFPGDQKFETKTVFDYKKGDHLYLSSIQTTTHIGAHADSSSHYHAKGEGIDQRPLSAYFGACQVIEVLKVSDTKENRIYPSDFKTEIKASRVLFKTNSFPDYNHWNSDFFALSPELIYLLKDKNVQLVGIDTPSVDPETSKTLDSHQALFQTGMCVLEGLWLPSVPEGLYQLVAMPLPFVDGDASPVRAILIKSDQPAEFELTEIKS
jgi:arylformamidase